MWSKGVGLRDIRPHTLWCETSVSSITSPSLASIRWESERRSVTGVLVVVVPNKNVVLLCVGVLLIQLGIVLIGYIQLGL